ncbi:MAG: 2Fe-2S iron-sulfur cluster-binding protein [Actinomycetota bacterium]|nr:2Fe-2S iron-sulfur cluster-binding protein [Actinomycetota bacterium]
MTQQATRPVTVGTSHRLAAQPGEVIDRSSTLDFTWNGAAHVAHPGDTIVSALAAAGVRVFSRSFKYHRPRGLLTASFHDPGCNLQVDDEPNVRAAHRLVEAGMNVSSQNTWPSLRFDVKAANQVVGRFLAPGFYYKTFIKPQRLWPAYEKILARFAHAGATSPDIEEGYYDKRYAHPDVLVAGAGPAGLASALAAADHGARVILVEEEHHLGGHLRWGGAEELSALAELTERVAQHENIEVLTNSVVLGRYDANWLGVVQRGRPDAFERLIKARAKVLVVASGAMERPYVFEGNDLPGVMLSTAVRRLINLYAVRPGNRAVVLSANPSGDAAADDLRRAGVDIAAVVDPRAGGDVVRACGRRGGLSAVELTDGRTIEADLLVTAVGWTTMTSLLNMAGNRPIYAPDAARFLPDPTTMPDDVLATGGVVGDGSLAELLAHGSAVGGEAATRAAARRRALVAATPTGRADNAPDSTTEGLEGTIPELSPDPHPELFRASTHGMVDFSEDVSSKDIISSAREGYDSAELVKRYTTVTMGPVQGKLEVVNAVAVLAEATGATIAETGTTTWRPMYAPVTLGALAGRIFEPVRYSPMQPWHERNGAVPMVAGQWIRPDRYGDPAKEVRAVREHVGIIDVTPIGKLDLRGPDVPKLLNQLYINKWSKLDVGKVRYGVMCAEDAVVMDDGVTGRLSQDHYLMSTTSSGAANVWEWVENWLQTEHPEWQVHVTPVTTAYASINVAGPRSRELIARMTEGVDLSADAFPYMHVRTGRIAGVDDCVLWRIGFTGELSYELHIPAGYGLHVWERLLEYGQDLGVLAFGVEAQRILRLEKGHLIIGQDTDGLTRAYSAGLAWAVKLDKADFAGKPELVWQSKETGGMRLVGLQPVDGTIVPPEASQIVRPGTGKVLDIIGRITSSRMSPTLNRSICLAQLDASLAEAGTVVTVRLPDGRDVAARVTEHLAHLDPAGERQQLVTSASDPVGEAIRRPENPRSPISPEGIASAELVFGTPAAASILVTDVSGLAKFGVRAAPDGAMAKELGTDFARTSAMAVGSLVVGSGPGEWIVLAEPDIAPDVLARLESAAGSSDDLVSLVDLTHGRALIRLTGLRCAELLAKVSGIDFSDDLVPDGSALRTSVAKLVTDVVRHNQENVASYLLHCERSSGRYLFEALVDAGTEFGVESVR